MATHSNILGGSPFQYSQKPGGLQFTVSQRVGHDRTHTHTQTQDNFDKFDIPPSHFFQWTFNIFIHKFLFLLKDIMTCIKGILKL